AGPRVDPFQVLQHPRQDLFLGYCVKEVRMKRHLAAVHFLDQLAAFLFGQQPSAIERVDQNLVFVVREFDDEVSGQSYSEDLQPDPPGNLQIKDRERYRDSRSAVDHVIEEAVARVEIVLGIAAEPQFAKEQVAEAHYSRERVGAKIIARSGQVGDRADLIQIVLDIETRILFSRDEQSR